MLKAAKVLDLLEKTPSKSAKVSILSENKSPELECILELCYSYRYLYFIKKIPGLGKTGAHVPNLDQIKAFAERLSSGLARTNEGKVKVFDYLSNLHPDVQKWMIRVIQRDLRCGVSIKLITAAGYDIPNFEAQLATDWFKVKKYPYEYAFISNKLNGYRCIAVVKDGDVTLFSRNGIVYSNFPDIESSLSESFPKGNYVFDGEVMAGSFNNVQCNAFAKKRKTSVSPNSYHIFDCISLEEWESQNFHDVYAIRYGRLTSTFSKDGISSNLILVVHGYYNLSCIDVIKMRDKAILEGYEGIMVKPNIPYYLGRKCNAMLKAKKMRTWDCEVIGFVKGKGRLSKTLGNLVVRQENGVTCEVGSGFTDDDRKDIWNRQEHYLGSVVEVQYQELSGDGVMLFPVFVMFRSDKE